MNGGSLRLRFDVSADTYEARASVQNTVAERLIAWLPAPETVRRVLEIGCGTGLLTRRLAARYPGARVEALDHSPRMVEAARRLCPGVSWHTTDLLAFDGGARYDLIASNCSLHWIDPLAAGFRKLRGLLAPGGRLVFSIMLDGTLGELRAVRMQAVPSKPPAGRLPTASETQDSLTSSGWTIADWREESLEEHHPSAMAFLRHIHELGLTGGAVSRAALPLTRGELAGVSREYDHRYPDGGGVKATYTVAYVSAAGAGRPPS